MGHVGNTGSRKNNSYIKGSKQKILLYGSKFERSWPRQHRARLPQVPCFRAEAGSWTSW